MFRCDGGRIFGQKVRVSSELGELPRVSYECRVRCAVASALEICPPALAVEWVDLAQGFLAGDVLLDSAPRALWLANSRLRMCSSGRRDRALLRASVAASEAMVVAGRLKELLGRTFSGDSVAILRREVAVASARAVIVSSRSSGGGLGFARAVDALLAGLVFPAESCR